jgi:hypothetical protein
LARAKTCSTSSTVKAIVSQKASTASARPARATAGSTVADQPQIARPVVAVFRRQCVGAEKAGDDIDRLGAPERPGGAQHPHLGFDIEAVARLDLDRRHPFGEQALEALAAPTRSSSSSDAARVALTVDTMPPPASAISA